MEIRQRKLESTVASQNAQIERLEKEIEIHREFLDLQFESFMDFLMQRGGDVVRIPSENGKEPKTGFFIPFTKPKRDDPGGGHPVDHQQQYHNEGDEISEHDTEEEDAPIYPPPQAILGHSSDDQQQQMQPLNYVNGNRDRSPVNLSNYHNNDRNSALKQEASEDEGDYNAVSSEDEAEDMTQQHPHHNNNEMNGESLLEESDDGDEDDETDQISYSNIQYLNQQSIQRFPFAHFLDGDGTDDNPHQMNGDHSSSDGADNILIAPVVNEYTLGPRRRTSSATPIDNQHVCRYCGKVFHWKQSWVIHERTHTGEKPYSCACGKAFSQKANMNTHAKQCKHAKAIHNGKTNIFEMKCSLCPKMFTSKKALDSHKLKSHPGSLTSMMMINNNHHSSSNNLRNSSLQNRPDLGGQGQIPTHNNSNLNQSIARASLLRKPNTQQQSQVSPESLLERTLASLSSKLLGNSGNGTRSQSHSHSNLIITSSSGSVGRPPGMAPPGKAKHCRWCNKFFSRKTSLKIHERVHTGERPFKCIYCGKTFTQKGSVKLHCQRVHNNGATGQLELTD